MSSEKKTMTKGEALTKLYQQLEEYGKKEKFPHLEKMMNMRKDHTVEEITAFLEKTICVWEGEPSEYIVHEVRNAKVVYSTDPLITSFEPTQEQIDGAAVIFKKIVKVIKM